MRLFVGVPLSGEIRDHLAAIREKIPLKLNWVPRDNYHITLKFLGETEPEKVTKRLETVKFEPFRIRLKGLGFFPDERHIRVFWAGLEPKEPLFELHKRVDIALSKYFAMQQDFKGHITIARVRHPGDIVKIARSINILPLEQDIHQFNLFKSTLTTNGPVYDVIRGFVDTK